MGILRMNFEGFGTREHKKNLYKTGFIHTLWVTKGDDLNKFLFELMM